MSVTPSTRSYEGIIVLDGKGREESVETLIQGIQKLLEANGAKIDSADHLGRREFAYAPDKIAAGHFVKFLFAAEPSALEPIREALKLRDEVHYQSFEKA